MNARRVEHRLPRQDDSDPVPPAGAPASRVHRRLAAYIASRADRRWVNVHRWPCPTVTGVLAVVAVGCMWGSIIGCALGGTAGAAFFLIGAIYGAPIGAIAGLVVGMAASLLLAALLVVRDRPATDTQRLARHVAGGLAALIELLATSALTVIAVHAVRARWGAVLSVAAVLLLSAEAVWLLRSAARDLLRTWARAWGWKVVR